MSELKTRRILLSHSIALQKKKKENKIISLVEEENLKEDLKRFIEKAISKGYVEYAGDELTVLFRQLQEDMEQEKRRKNRY